MNDTIVINENSKHDFFLWLKSTWFFGSWLIFSSPFTWLMSCWRVVLIHPRLVTWKPSLLKFQRDAIFARNSVLLAPISQTQILMQNALNGSEWYVGGLSYLPYRQFAIFDQQLSDFIDVFISFWCRWPPRTSIVLNSLTTTFKAFIPLVHLCFR